MSKQARIVFFGTPEFAVHCLNALLTAKKHIVAVVTSPDRKAGRGKKLRTSAVGLVAKEKQLPLLQPENLQNPEFIAELKALQPDLMIVVAFRMLPKIVWAIPRLGTFNLHASLLPNYRGAAPINWALINQEKESGLTTFLIDDKIDTGKILMQEKITIGPKETAGSLHDRMATKGGDLILQTCEGLENGTLTPKAQASEGAFPLAPKLDKTNTKIDWTQSLAAIEAQIRGLSPYPGAWTTLKSAASEIVIKIFEAKIVLEKHTHPAGKVVVENKTIAIAHPQGWLICEALQLPNKRSMLAKELLNGYQFEALSRVE